MRLIVAFIILLFVFSCTDDGNPYPRQGNLLIAVIGDDYSVIEFAEMNTVSFSGLQSIPFSQSTSHDNANVSYQYLLVGSDTITSFEDGRRNSIFNFQNQSFYDQSLDYNVVGMNASHFDIYSNTNVDVNQIWNKIKSFEVVQAYFEHNPYTNFVVVKLVESIFDPVTQTSQPEIRFYVLIPG